MDNKKETGRLYIIGIGPGDLAQLTVEAKNALAECDCIVGYKPYLITIKTLIEGKEIHSFAMKQEVDRVKKAIELAKQNRKVALISSGDPGIYAMAGPALELTADENIEVKIVPGISALNMSASILGAPLMHDFTVISLSDLLTPLDLIKKRIKAAAEADFVIVIYNPKSKGRPDIINSAQKIILKTRSSQTPIGIVRKEKGEQKAVISNLADFTSQEIDMLSTVIIGNSKTFVANNRMITPRGYII